MKRLACTVTLTDEERKTLQDILDKGKHPSKQIKRVKILLALDGLRSWPVNHTYRPTQESIANLCGVSTTTVYNITKQYEAEGLAKTLERKSPAKPPIQPIITGEIEAKIIALACSEPPKGYARWTLRLLENKVVELGIMEKVSDTTIGRMLKKRRSSPIEKNAGVSRLNKTPLL